MLFWICNLRPHYALSKLGLNIIAGFIILVGLNGCGSRPERSSIQSDDAHLMVWIEEEIAYLSGTITTSTPAQLTALVTKNPHVRTLALVDIQGSVDQQATIDAARLVRHLGLNTHIVRTGYVVSGGVDLFLGGVERSIGAGAGVGVHAWFDATTAPNQEVNLADPIHATYVNFYLEMGVPERFYWFTLDASPPERLYFLSPEEIYDLRLVTH